MNLFAIAGLSVVITCISLFFVVLYFGREKIHKIWAIFNLVVAFWGFGCFLVGIADNLEHAILGWKIAFAGGFFISVFFYHTVCIFGNLKRRIIIFLGYIFFAIFSFMSMRGYILKDWQIAGPIYTHTHNLLFDTGFIVWGIIMIMGFYELIKIYKNSIGIKKIQSIYLLIGFAIGFAGGTSVSALPYGIETFIYGNFSIPIYALIVTYAIFKYQLLDIRVVIRRALVYSIGIAVISGIIVGISFLSSWFAERVPGFQFWTVPLIAGITAFIIGNLFWRKSKEVNKLKYEFITVAAHKLRTPLTEIKWATENAKEKIIDEKERLKLISGIEKANIRLLTLTDQLLSIAKTEAKEYIYKPELTDLGKLARNTIKDLETDIKQKNINLTLNIEPNLPKANIDRIRISSVIQMFIENAITYTKDTISIDLRKDKNYLLFLVKDNGIGIPKQDQPHIFTRFYRTHQAYLTETEGSGMSLYLSKSIIDRHNGKISVKSEGEGKGSEFLFRLPIGV